MDLGTATNEALNDAKTKISLAIGKPVAIALHVVVLGENAQPEGVFLGSSFPMTPQTVMPLMQGLLMSVAQQGAPINGRPN